MSDSDGSGSSSGRYGVRSTSPETIWGEVRTHLQTQGREIGEIRRKLEKLDEVSTRVTEMATILPHLVTKEHCAESRAATIRDMKDRMDGKSEVTGMNMSLPEMWKKAQEVMTEDRIHRNVVPVRGARYWITLTAGIISLLGCLIGMTTFVVKTLERQERTEQVLRTLERSVR